MAIINFCGYQTGALNNAKTEGTPKPNAKPINPVKTVARGKAHTAGTAPREGRGTYKEVGSIGRRCSIMRWEPVIGTGVRNLQSGRWFNWG